MLEHLGVSFKMVFLVFVKNKWYHIDFPLKLLNELGGISPEVT